MKLTRPIAFLDIESATPGPRPDPVKDKIVVLAVTIVRPDLSIDSGHVWRFNPGFQMSPGNIACHGITNEMVANWDRISVDHGNMMLRVLDGKDIAGFNHTNYDIPLMWEELYRLGIEWNLDGVHLVDVGTVFKKKEERSLEAAVQFYCGRQHVGAHDANNDVIETINVFKAQLERYKDLDALPIDQLAAFSRHEERLDLAGKIIKGPDGQPTYNFGKARGVAVVDDKGFGHWMLNRDFSENTKRAVRKALGIDNQSDLL